MFSLEKDLSGKILILKEGVRAFFCIIGPGSFDEVVLLKKLDSILILGHTRTRSSLKLKILTENAQILYLNWSYMTEVRFLEFFKFPEE